MNQKQRDSLGRVGKWLENLDQEIPNHEDINNAATLLLMFSRSPNLLSELLPTEEDTKEIIPHLFVETFVEWSPEEYSCEWKEFDDLSNDVFLATLIPIWNSLTRESSKLPKLIFGPYGQVKLVWDEFAEVEIFSVVKLYK